LDWTPDQGLTLHRVKWIEVVAAAVVVMRSIMAVLPTGLALSLSLCL